MHNFNSIVLGSIDIAQTEALKRKNTQLDAYHLLFGLLKNGSSFLSRTYKDQLNSIEDKLKGLATSSNEISLEQIRPSTSFQTWVTMASSFATQNGETEILESHLIRFIPEIFKDLDWDFSKLNLSDDPENEVPDFLTNLNELAKLGKLDPVIGRTQEIRALMEILGRRSKNNPVLVGPAGVGKTAIVEGLADLIIKNKVPDILHNKTLYSLDLGSLMAGTKFRGEFEERLKKLIQFIKSQNGQAILFIDEIHQLVGAGRTDGAMDAANLLKPALARGELNCIGATTEVEYQKYILGDSALDRRFRSVPVDEPTKEDCIEIMVGLKEKLEAHHGIKISDDALINSVLLSIQYITDKNLPDKAIDLVDEASAALKLSAEAMPDSLAKLEDDLRINKIKLQVEPDNQEISKLISEQEELFKIEKQKWEEEVLSMRQVSDYKNRLEKLKFDLDEAQREGNFELASQIKYALIPEVETELSKTQHENILNKSHVAQVISRQKGIPLEKILSSEQENLLKLEDFLKLKVLGQSEALEEVADTLITSHAGLSDQTRPMGSFLLKGPSGVGKTETAKQVCEFLFDNQTQFIRIDLSEFSEKHSVAKLIGAPAGYVGYDEGGILTEAVRLRPYSVILFDEVEKAHRDFSDILLQILDDGRLTDNKGRVIDFKNTIIFITTNAQDVEQAFKPEVIGRLDAVLDYNSLDASVVSGLVLKQVELLNERLKSKKVQVSLSNKMRSYLENHGFSESYGARPLRSLFEKMINRPLSKFMISGKLDEGSIEIDLNEETKKAKINKS